MLGNPAARGGTGDVERVVDELRAEEGNYRILTPDQAIELVRTHGYLGLQPLCGGVAPDLAWRSLHLIESDVLPRV